MDVSYLGEFVTLAKYGKLAPAARRLGIAPSTLSGHITALENELGASLFERGNGFALNEAGEMALEHAQKAIAEVEYMRRACHNRPAEHVTFRMPNYAFKQRPLMAVRQAFIAAHPEVDVRIKTSEREMDDPVDALLEGSEDVTVYYTVSGYGPTIEELLPHKVSSIDIGRLRYEYYTTPGHPLAQKNVLDLADFDNQAIIFSLCSISEVCAKGMQAFFESHGVRISAFFRKVHRHADVFLSGSDEYLMPRFERYPPELPDVETLAHSHATAFDMPIEVNLLYMPARLSPLQLEYLEFVERAAAQFPLV